MKSPKIDIVYLWVDGSDKNWRNEKDKWYKKIIGKVPMGCDSVATERFRDNGELMYSLRSVAECAPWINHIYIVTGFNQIPKWLNTKNKKLTIISHEQIMPADALPTFNSVSIEMCISNIKNLREHFLLMNDDTFFNKKVSPLYFYDKSGNAKYRYSTSRKLSKKELKNSTAYTQTIFNAQEAISKLFNRDVFKYSPSHGIDPYLKSSIKQCLNEPTLHNKFQTQIHNKFRTCDEFQRIIFNLYDFVKGRAKFIHAHAIKYGKHKFINTLYNMLYWFSIRKSNVYVSNVIGKKYVLKHVATFCINDGPENDTNILKRNREFLEKRFPKKCEFEK